MLNVMLIKEKGKYGEKVLEYLILYFKVYLCKIFDSLKLMVIFLGKECYCCKW